MADVPNVIVYTDGACDPNPGVGGWAVLLQFQGSEKTLSGGEAKTTNNRMELTAAIQALRALKQSCRVKLHTDSTYLKRGVTEWLPGWRKRGWKRKEGSLANADLWKELDALIKVHQVEWIWVRGHSDNRENERVDYLAKKAIRNSHL